MTRNKTPNPTPPVTPDPLALWDGANVEAPTIRYPWVAINPDGAFLFPADADADPVTAGIAGLLTSTTYGRDRKPYGSCASLRLVLLARRTRFVDDAGRAWATWDEARTAGAVVRGHTQVAAVLLSAHAANHAGGAPLWSAPGDADPVIVTLTARGVQGMALARLVPTVAERLAGPASSELRRPLPVSAFAVHVGFGTPTTVGDYGYTFAPVQPLDPALRVRDWRAYTSAASAVPGIRAAYDDAQTWAAQWSPDALRSSRERAAAVAEPSPTTTGNEANDDGVPW